uniref:Uncharacterized protein n=1 Tax=Rhizophora mucronata TaxID=61149 RepID=A0A2P2J2B1_RHIMU
MSLERQLEIHDQAKSNLKQTLNLSSEPFSQYSFSCLYKLYHKISFNCIKTKNLKIKKKKKRRTLN